MIEWLFFVYVHDNCDLNEVYSHSGYRVFIAYRV